MNPSIKEALHNGIRRAARNNPNSQSLISADNLRALSPYGLVDFIDIQQPITNAALATAGVTKSWPTPQLFKGRGVTLLADATALYSVTESATGNWTISPLTVYDWTTYNADTDAASTDAITTGKSWQFLDLWDGCWMLFNGTGVVFKTGFSSKVFWQEAVTIGTGCVYQDARVVYGGFDSSDTYALTDWAAYWNAYGSQFPDDYTAKTLSGGLGTNWVWWSSIGFEDMWWLFDRDFMVNGTLSSTRATGFSEARPFWASVWGRREEGAMPMPWSGTVLHTQQLGGAVMVYGTNGVSAIEPFETSMGMSGASQQFANIGIMQKGSSRGAVGGDETVHAYIDEAGDLRVVDATLKMENLERRQLFSSMTAPLVSYDPQQREFWIGENDNMYVLTRTGGLSRAPMAPTTVYFGRANNASAASGISFPNSSDTPAFQSEWMEMGEQDAVPQIMSLTLVGSGTWSLGLKYRRYPGDSDQDTGLIACDNGGSVEIHASCVAFSVYGQASARSGAKVFDVRFEMADGSRRSISSWLT